MEQTAPRPSRRTRVPVARSRSWSDTAVPVLPVVACFLGGATQKWAEGVIVGLLGLLLLLRPPRFSLGAAMNGILLALLGCAATAFLPARWFVQPAWRQALVTDFAVDVGSIVSPQPWLSFGCFLSLLAGLSWLYLVATQDIDTQSVRRQLRIFAGCVTMLAALAVTLYLGNAALPFWHNQRGFGPFPNRNQTADLLGITSVVILACGQDDIRQNRKRWIFWLVAFAIVMAAIVLNLSRAGIAILVAASALWLGGFALRRGPGARLAIGACALLGLLTIMLVFGGQTLERFNFRGDGACMTSDFRWLIFQDTWQLIRNSPWCGIGLANFEQVFAIFRNASVGQSKSLHPESDWLWVCAELGWPAVLLVVAGAALLIRRVFPLSEGTNQRFRLAAFIAALLFGLHGFVDVSAHRVGTAYAGLLLLGLSLRRPLQLRLSAAAPMVFRFVGLVLVSAGAAWTYAAYAQLPLPGGVGADQARAAAAGANQKKDFAATIAHVDRGLKWAPLDWQLYFLRALGKVGEGRMPADALEDFRRARFLEPNSFEVPYQEGMAWLTRQPLLALTAWREALRRAGPQRSELYGRLLSNATQSSPVVARMLEDYGIGQHDLALAYLDRLSGPQFNAALQRLLENHAALEILTGDERSKLFALWAERGDLEQLASFVDSHPELLRVAWRGVARFRAANKEFEGAYELAKQFGERPALPQKANSSSIQNLERSLYASPNNFAVGFALYDEQVRAGRFDDALMTVRHFTDEQSAPAYFHFLEAEAWAAKQNWERAWSAWQAFEAAKK